MHEKVHDAITSALTSLGIEECVFVVEHPADPTHGEYATNAALVASKHLGKSPREVALAIVALLEGKISGVARMEVAGPGFINFHLTRDFFVAAVLGAHTAGAQWGTNTTLAGKKVMVEYTDPNPFKELHIGHLVPNALGEALACLMEYSGAEVRRVTFQGDVGMHVAKGIYGLLKAGATPDALTPEMLGKAYADGATAFDADAAIADEIKALNKTIYERSDDRVNELYDAGKKISMAYFEKAYKILGSSFDHYFMESITGPIGKALVQEHLGTVFTQSDGAVIYEGEKHGLHTRVFINAAGIPTYEAKDLGLVRAKHEWWPFDLSITVTGTEQQHYFAVVAKAMGEVLPHLAGSVELAPCGMLRLREGKMSSRTGNIIRALDLLDDVTKRVREVMGDRAHEVAESVATTVAVAAVKYVILRSAAGRDIIFDLKSSVSLDGDSGPYVQYAHARACSVIAKAHDAGIEASDKVAPEALYSIERLIYRFPEVIQRAANERQPHYVITYLTELAAAWNAFYAHERIADVTDTHAPYKLLIAEVVANTLHNGLAAVGIAAPEAM